MNLCRFWQKKPNVHVLRGNCEWGRNDFMTDEQWAWVDSLPIIIESQDFIFVHAGLEDKPLAEQDVKFCLTHHNFWEEYEGGSFEKWVVVGHWPVSNYHHQIPNHNPIICHKKRIISIDGGMVLKSAGQINAFIVNVGDFSWEYADALPTMTMPHNHKGNMGTINITWFDRFVDIVDHGEIFTKIRYDNKEIFVPTNKIWQDDKNRYNTADQTTNHHLSVKKNDIISVVEKYDNKIYAKINGEAGWVNLIKEE